MTTKNKTTIIVKYLKDAQFDSKLFKVCESTSHKCLDKFIKTWDDEKFIYLKNKYLDMNKEELERLKYYKMKIYFDSFKNGEDKEVLYICKVRHKLTEYHELVKEDKDSDNDW